MSELHTIESLSAEIARLTADAELWKNIRLASGAIAIILAVATLAAQTMEIRRARAVAVKQRELAALKDATLKQELAEKDLKISAANLSAVQAKERTEALEIDASRAKESQQRVETELTAQRERTARAERATEELRRENLEMQESLSPRTLLWNQTSETRLAKFSGTPWSLRVTPGDVEATTFANSIGAALEKAQWVFGDGATDFSRSFAPGVIVSVRSDALYHQAGLELVAYLTANRVHAVLSDGDGTPTDKLLVDVGPKPRLAILTPTLNEADRLALVERDKETKQRMDTERKKWKFPPFD